MAETINFGKVDRAFQNLADTPEGNQALEGLRAALDAVGQTAPELNSDETHYLLANLVQQRVGGFGPAAAASGARVAGGFIIKTAVDVE